MARQEKPQSFEDHQFFPSFPDCPVEYAWDDRYFVDSNSNDPNSTGKNRMHCFVVAFYPDDSSDMPRLLRNFKAGNTIAIFYAVVHDFVDGTSGVRVEDTDGVMILPLAFQDVIKMNEQVIAYTPADGAQRRCHGCGEAKQDLGKCARCTLFYYSEGWFEEDHNKFCKVLRDENVQRMHFLDYGNYDGNISFR
ncbi:hypothetical protein GGR52DRAFT_586189 [Hypoxylon sp. FL1284]|nr:hypothetical protein GGR52DRAFT_586189 [Hypoxylon sp. FL1284]